MERGPLFPRFDDGWYILCSHSQSVTSKGNVFKNVPLFTGLSPDALTLLHDRSTMTDYAGGAVIVAEGECDDRIFVMVSGWVRVCMNLGTPRETELATLSDGEFFGEMSILDTLPRSASVQAVIDSRILSLRALAFWELHDDTPREYGVVILNIARDLSRRLRHLDHTVAARV